MNLDEKTRFGQSARSHSLSPLSRVGCSGEGFSVHIVNSMQVMPVLLLSGRYCVIFMPLCRFCCVAGDIGPSGLHFCTFVPEYEQFGAVCVFFVHYVMKWSSRGPQRISDGPNLISHELTLISHELTLISHELKFDFPRTKIDFPRTNFLYKYLARYIFPKQLQMCWICVDSDVFR